MISLEKLRMPAYEFLNHAIGEHLKTNKTIPIAFGVPQQMVDELNKDHRTFKSSFRGMNSFWVEYNGQPKQIMVIVTDHLPHLIDNNYDVWSI